MTHMSSLTSSSYPGLATDCTHHVFFYFKINLPVYLSTHCKKRDKTRHLNQLSVYQISVWQLTPSKTDKIIGIDMNVQEELK